VAYEPISKYSATLEECAAELGLTRVTISSLQASAVQKVRAGLIARGIDAEFARAILHDARQRDHVFDKWGR
jgi:hypothetical protein